MIRQTAALLVFALTATPALAQDDQAPTPKYNYPTSARADYVIGCLAANGMKHEYLDRCSCGIDTIANMMSYEDYQKAATILSMQQPGVGQRGAEFRNTPVARDTLKKLHEAQAEANLRCH